jgi:uncharacterized protein (DUF305 family)
MSFTALPRWARYVLGALTVVLVLAIGYSGRILVENASTPGDASVDAGFARDMSTHHAQAVELAMIVYPKATLEEVHTIAYDISTSQSVEIGVMQTWLANWHLSPTSDQAQMSWMPKGQRQLSANGLMPGIATAADVDKLRKATGKDADILFCQLMIQHHLGGLHMIDGLLQETSNPQVRKLAESMKTVQTGEVTRMQQLLTQLGV